MSQDSYKRGVTPKANMTDNNVESKCDDCSSSRSTDLSSSSSSNSSNSSKSSSSFNSNKSSNNGSCSDSTVTSRNNSPKKRNRFNNDHPLFWAGENSMFVWFWLIIFVIFVLFLLWWAYKRSRSMA